MTRRHQQCNDDAVSSNDACSRCGPSPAVPMQLVCPMDLLALSGGLVPVAAKRKAVRKWAERRQFWACINDDFVAPMGAIGSGGGIWQCHGREDALMCVVIEGRQGRRERRDEGDQKSVQTLFKLGSRG
jgi:hypothetical protein